MSIKYFAMRGETNIGYIIAPPNATEEDKKKADLVLDDVNGSPHTQLADMVDMLHDRRGQNTDIAIVIEFCPGEFELPNGTNWEIPEGKGNFYIYGNGVKFNGNIEDEILFSVVDCWLFDLEVKNNSYDGGILAYNSTLTNCSGSSGGGGILAYNSTLTNCSGSGGDGGILATNSTLTNCSGSSEYEQGIHATNSTLTNCSGSSGYSEGISAYNSTLINCSGSCNMGSGIYAEGSCIIQGCDGGGSGISVPSTGTYPQTLELLQQLNKGTITIRS